ncbi:hypothetical protein [Candidatus Nitrosotenuis cloacae]|nr:hypothetical protein [Candidatus Nitrosotenuis cloacae]
MGKDIPMEWRLIVCDECGIDCELSTNKQNGRVVCRECIEKEI